MKRNSILFAFAIASQFCIASCNNDDDTSVNDIIQQRLTSTPTVELESRTLSVTPGYNAPKNSSGNTIDADDLAIDLGIGVKFAAFDLGATAVGEAGDLYGWGEIESKEEVSWATYDYHDAYEPNTNAEKDPTSNGGIFFINKYCFDIYGEINDCSKGQTLLSNDDAAYVQWGSEWRMPTSADFEKLFSNIDLTSDGDDEKCLTATWNSETSYYVIKNKETGAELILPCVSHITETGVYKQADGSNAGYWTSSLSNSHSTKATVFLPKLYKSDYSTDMYRFYGYYIRPVLDE